LLMGVVLGQFRKIRDVELALFELHACPFRTLDSF